MKRAVKATRPRAKEQRDAAVRALARTIFDIRPDDDDEDRPLDDTNGKIRRALGRAFERGRRAGARS